MLRLRFSLRPFFRPDIHTGILMAGGKGFCKFPLFEASGFLTDRTRLDGNQAADPLDLFTVVRLLLTTPLAFRRWLEFSWQYAGTICGLPMAEGCVLVLVHLP